MYLIETKVFHSSAFPALFYLTLVLSTILIWSTTSLGYGGDRAYADSKHVFVFTRIAKSWVGPGKRLRIHLIWLVSWTAGHETIIWCEWRLLCCYPYAGLMGLVSYLMSLVIFFEFRWFRFTSWGQSSTLLSWSANIYADNHPGVWQAGTQE